MFQFAGLPLPSLCVQLGVTGNGPRWVAPFGDPRVIGYVPLTAAYRSLSRPSSASSAKASTVCPYHLLLDGSVHTYTARSSLRARSDAIFLKKKISSLSRYAALKVREGGDPQDRVLRPWGRRRHQREMDGHCPESK